MSRRKYIFYIAFLLLVFIIYGCTNRSVDKVVPKNLFNCPEKYFEKNYDGYYTVNCHVLPEETICAYYKAVTDNKEEIYSLEFKNECEACLYFGEDGVWQSENTEFNYLQLIGYIKDSCKDNKDI